MCVYESWPFIVVLLGYLSHADQESSQQGNILRDKCTIHNVVGVNTQNREQETVIVE